MKDVNHKNKRKMKRADTPEIPHGEILLDVKDLSVAYGPIQALKNVSMHVKKGSIVAILGSNGAGKTTLLKKVSGLIPASAGTVTFMGRDITKLAPEKITQRGIVQSPEGRQLFSDLSVYENLAIGAFTIKVGQVKRRDVVKEAMTNDVKQQMAATEDDDALITLPPRAMMRQNLRMVYNLFPVLEERRDQIAETLSGGEQQMLAIGRALMGTPELLVLDEPSLGLAPLIVKDIFSIIDTLNKRGITVLIVEQNARETLKIADYAYVLQVGKLVQEGPAAKLLKDDSLVEAYLGK